MISSLSLLLFGLLLILVSTVIGFFYKRKQNRIKQQRLKGISWLKLMRQLLAKIQKHRGLSSGYHAGKGELMSDINSLQIEITWDFQEINAVGNWVVNNERWQAVSDHWQRLSIYFQKLSMEDNLKQHNHLIANLLYLIEDTAEVHQLGELDGQLAFIWKELLASAEHVGQARAIGTAVTASGNCDGVNRIRLAFLSGKINRTIGLIKKNLNSATQTVQAMEQLLDCISNEVVKDKPSISSQHYFSLASDCLDGILAHFDQELRAIDARV